jgi:hypothetical protein
MGCYYFFSELVKEKGKTSEIILKELRESYIMSKETCKILADFYLKTSNVEEITNAVNSFKKEYKL